MGDLLAADPAHKEYLKESLQHYAAAVKQIERFGVHWRLVSDIREKQQRARTVLATLSGAPVPAGVRIRQPERLLTGLPEEKAWERLLAHGMENEAWGRPDDALRLYELAAVAISRRLAFALDETTIRQIGDQCATGYHLLARSYMRAARHEDALNASETLRAATVRAARQGIDRKELADSVRRTGTYYPPVGGLTGIRDVMVDVLGQLRLLPSGSFAPGLGFLSVSVGKGTALASLVWREDDEWRTAGLDWEYEKELFDDLGHLHSKADSLTFRMPMFQRVLPRLSRTLLAPVLGLLSDHHIDKLAISTGGLLSRIPFEALPIDGSQCLAERFKVSYVPSIPLAAEFPVRSADVNPRLLVVSYPDADLPNVASEVQSIEDMWAGNVHVLRAERASKRDVLDSLTGVWTNIHFACHADFNPVAPLQSSLQLRSRADQDRYRVTAEDLLSTSLTPGVTVTLSACSSALTSFGITNDCSGLTGSLLRAGAGAVIGSRWAVRDETGDAFMTSLYMRLLHQEEPALAVHAVQRQLAERVELDDWAAFSYLGKPPPAISATPGYPARKEVFHD
ncbi:MULTISPECIES: CHAT domain-containing protein [unclassified Streptomyces]|uniref:CHAT domain-containing protein n=1 Tax=unclassified Streptomyces TaxID=2593676 RepID=UPI0038309268